MCSTCQGSYNYNLKIMNKANSICKNNLRIIRYKFNLCFYFLEKK